MSPSTKKLTKQAIEIIFAKVRALKISKRSLGANKIDFYQFLEVCLTTKSTKEICLAVSCFDPRPAQLSSSPKFAQALVRMSKHRGIGISEIIKKITVHGPPKARCPLLSVCAVGCLTPRTTLAMCWRTFNVTAINNPAGSKQRLSLVPQQPRPCHTCECAMSASIRNLCMAALPLALL